MSHYYDPYYDCWSDTDDCWVFGDCGPEWGPYYYDPPPPRRVVVETYYVREPAPPPPQQTAPRTTQATVQQPDFFQSNKSTIWENLIILLGLLVAAYIVVHAIRITRGR